MLPIPGGVKTFRSVVLSLPIAGFLTRSQPGEQALIVDAGGGTLDINTYKVLSNRPLQVEELYESQCESHSSQWHVFSFKSSISGFVRV